MHSGQNTPPAESTTEGAVPPSSSAFLVDADSVPLAIVRVDATGRVCARNRRAAAAAWLPAQLPTEWLGTGPIAAALHTGRSSSGPAPTPIRGTHKRLTCTPTAGGLQVVLQDIPAPGPPAEPQLRFYTEVLQLGGVGGWEVDLETMTPVWSNEVCRIHDRPVGYTPDLDEAIQYYEPEARPIMRDAVARSIQTGEHWDLELPLRTATGRSIWVRACGKPIMRDGVCVRLLGSFEDITERRLERSRLQSAVGRSDAYTALFRNANALLALANMEGHFTTLNERWSELLGWSTEELMAVPFLSFVHADDRDRTLAEAQALAAPGHQTVDFQNRYRCRDGTCVHLSWVATADPDKNTIYAVAHDITKEVVRAQQLERLALIAARTTNAVLITNTMGHVEWANESFSRITGFDRADIIGRRPGELLQGPGTDPEEVARIRQQVRLRQPFEATLLNYRRSGEPYWISVEAKPLFDQQGAFTGYMAVEADVTEEHSAKQELIAERDRAELLANEARAAAKAKSDFLAVMSHELRTPMNGILGTAELLELSPLAPEQRELLGTLRTAGRSLLSILNDILDYSKFETGKFEVEQTPFALPETIRAAADLFRANAERRGLRFSVELSPDLPERVLGDTLRLRQILVNLLGNAFKFTQVGGVTLRAELVRPDRLRAEVRDTGIGIADDRVKELFQPFSQVDASARRRFGGTGLGLAICQSLLDLMGGVTGVESTVGEGSTFWFEIPLEPVEAMSEELTSEPISPSLGVTGHRVLLVEDNPVNQLVTRQMLVHLGCSVTVAADGVAALAEFAPGRFDVVLMDCHMPRLDGWAATRELRVREVDFATDTTAVVVAQTASCMPEDVRRCQAAGMNDILAKPIQLEALARLLRRLGQDQGFDDWAPVGPSAQSAAPTGPALELF